MILVDRDIMAARERGEIVIDPFDRKALGTNSYDVHLAPTLKVYFPRWRSDLVLDCKHKKPPTEEIVIPPDGYVLEPEELYLASTIEYTESHAHVPMLNGKSSLGRLGLSIHVTAGSGDVGFLGHWTMEMFVIKRLRVYPWMPIGQLLWFAASGPPDVAYHSKPGAKYINRVAMPMASDMALNFDKPGD